jgi:hypothetical protein
MTQTSDKENASHRVVKHNEKFNVPIQSEKEEAEVFEDAKPEHLANEGEIRRKKTGIE